MYLLDFSDEIIEKILLQKEISSTVLCYLCRTCKRLNEVASTNVIWKEKLFERWPIWECYPHGYFKDIYKQRIQSNLFVLREVEKINRECLDFRLIPNKLMKNILERCYNKNQMVFESLISILNEAELHIKRMDLIYYTKKVYAFARQYQRRLGLFDFVHSTDGDFFDGVKLLAGFIEVPNRDSIEKMIQLKDTVEKLFQPLCQNAGHDDVIKLLRDVNEFLVKDDTFLNQIFLSLPETRRLLLSSTLRYCYYVAVISKLEVDIKLIKIPDGFITSVSTEKCVTYIDYQDGVLRLLSENECQQSYFPTVELDKFKKYLRAVNKKELIASLMDDVIYVYQKEGALVENQIEKLQWVLETLIELTPEENGRRMFLVQLYLHQAVNIEEADHHLKYVIEQKEQKEYPLDFIQPMVYLKEKLLQKKQEKKYKLRSSPRNKEVCYKIGMVMKHRRFNYSCVIYGWDHFCDMSYNWQQQMGVISLPNGASQPFYNVLANDGSNRYAAQESLQIHPNPPSIVHQDVGKYFSCQINPSRYKASEVLIDIYPEDYED